MPGPDGLPYAIYRALGLPGLNALYKVNEELRRGVLPPPEFNQSSMSFVPKGSQPMDSVELIRDPSDPPPLP